MTALFILTSLSLCVAVVAWWWHRAGQALLAEQVRIALEQRLAQAQLERITFLAMQRLLDEARQSSRRPS
ncbi:MAG: hypothetical protein IPJ14_09720 [Kineosporiaceae bacterium]|nr:hypothetical protein [Kineosporiaceae bacterium]